MDFLISTAHYAWEMLVEAAPYIWLGLLAAGMLHIWVPKEWVTGKLGGQGQGAVWKAALLGVPLPLCSCGVIPAATGLRKQGASQGATLSFLISTPETSVDSIAVTYALMGPVWAVIRPVAAVFTAVLTGSAANFVRDPQQHTPDEVNCAVCGEPAGHTHTHSAKLRGAWDFVFKELLTDIGPWLLLGIAISGVVLALLPADFFQTVPGGVWTQMLTMLVIGIPLYICASASTPLAAALLLKGMAPGAALVLLLAGPATNVASALVVTRQLGKTGTAVYFGGVAVGSLVAGAIVQWLTPNLRLGEISLDLVTGTGPLGAAAAISLVGAIAVAMAAERRRKSHAGGPPDTPTPSEKPRTTAA